MPRDAEEAFRQFCVDYSPIFLQIGMFNLLLLFNIENETRILQDFVIIGLTLRVFKLHSINMKLYLPTSYSRAVLA